MANTMPCKFPLSDSFVTFREYHLLVLVGQGANIESQCQFLSGWRWVYGRINCPGRLKNQLPNQQNSQMALDQFLWVDSDIHPNIPLKISTLPCNTILTEFHQKTLEPGHRYYSRRWWTDVEDFLINCASVKKYHKIYCVTVYFHNNYPQYY